MDQTHSNLEMLKFVANKLEELRQEVVFLGGCATALLITDTGTPDVRTTLDVDCIIDVLSLMEYQKIEKQLRDKGFKQLITDDVICRWHYEEIILDIMPTDEKILGFSNRWYKASIEDAMTHQLNDELVIKSVTAPYFIATKLEAFKTRGHHDFLTSHDFEDIITVIDGREELANEITKADDCLKEYLKENFKQILMDKNFLSILPGLVNYGSLAEARAEIILKRINNIINKD